MLQHAYPRSWVVGEIQRLQVSRAGHAYLELVEKGERDRVVGKLDAVIWRSSLGRLERRLASSGQQLAEHLEIRCRGRLDLYPPSGRLQLVVDDIDPVFTLGRMELLRRETLARLAADGLLDRNRGLELAPVPLRVGLVTSAESAAYHDFVESLRESGYGFEVRFVHAPVQGPEAAAALASAIRSFRGAEIDCLVVTRGGGARSDLAAFDQPAVAEAVATSVVPVISGVGHETDETICDRVAHSRAKTPTGAAELLVLRVRESEAALERTARRLCRRSIELVTEARSSLRHAGSVLRSSGALVRRAGRELDRLARSIGAGARRAVYLQHDRISRLRERAAHGAPRLVAAGRRDLEHRGRWIAHTARGRLALVASRLDGWGRLCDQLSPARTLERGFSITRREDGALVRSIATVEPGVRVRTELADGVVTSRIEETEERATERGRSLPDADGPDPGESER